METPKGDSTFTTRQALTHTVPDTCSCAMHISFRTSLKTVGSTNQPLDAAGLHYRAIIDDDGLAGVLV